MPRRLNKASDWAIGKSCPLHKAQPLGCEVERNEGNVPEERLVHPRISGVLADALATWQRDRTATGSQFRLGKIPTTAMTKFTTRYGCRLSWA